MKRTRLLLLALFWPLVLPLAGCVTPLVTYNPQGGNVVYDAGAGAGAVGTLAATTPESRIQIAPTFLYETESDPPTFTLSVTNTSKRGIDVDPVKFEAFIDDQPAHVYSLVERVQEIRTSAARKETVVAVLGVAAAAAGAYGASHSTDTSVIQGVAHHRAFTETVTTKTYDPAAGILTGVLVLKATDVGIKQIQNAAGSQEKAAQAIFQHTSVAPHETVLGQIVVKSPGAKFTKVRVLVAVAGGKPQEFVFVRQRHSNKT